MRDFWIKVLEAVNWPYRYDGSIRAFEREEEPIFIDAMQEADVYRIRRGYEDGRKYEEGREAIGKRTGEEREKEC